MKNLLYISLLISIFFISCGENDNMYDGEQAFFFGEAKNITFTVEEENTTNQLAYGLMNPAQKDYEFTIRIVENTGGSKVKANGVESGELSLKIAKGERVGYINIEADFDQLEANVDEMIQFQLADRGNLDCQIIDTTYTLVIQKFCALTSDRIKEWEGIYMEEGEDYELTVRHVAGDTLEIENFWGYSIHPAAKLGKIKVVLDYSTNKYTVMVVNGYFYTQPNGVPVEIQDNRAGTPLVPQAIDFCAKKMLLYYYLKVETAYYGYYLSPIYKVRDLP